MGELKKHIRQVGPISCRLSWDDARRNSSEYMYYGLTGVLSFEPILLLSVNEASTNNLLIRGMSNGVSTVI